MKKSDIIYSTKTSKYIFYGTNYSVKGLEYQLLEEEFANFQSVKFGTGVNSGTSALHLSLLASGAKPGDDNGL